jgi:hypothetical protein
VSRQELFGVTDPVFLDGRKNRAVARLPSSDMGFAASQPRPEM